MINIIHTNYGIASRIKDDILINKKLLNYPRLYEKILEHEKKHSSDFCLKDILLDLRNEEIKDLKKDYYSFILKNPSSLTEFLPIFIYQRKIIFNPVLTIFYLLILFTIIIGVILL